MKPDIVRRYAHNPILSKAEIPYPVETVHNAAVVKHGDEYVMLFRSHLRTGRSIIGLARSPDGFHFTADPEPFLTPARDGPFAAYEEFGVEDPRVTRLEGEYIITYSAYSRNGVRVGEETETESVRSVSVGLVLWSLGRMALGSLHRQTANRHSVAPQGISTVLDLESSPRPTRRPAGVEGNP